MCSQNKEYEQGAKYLREYIASETVLRSVLPYSELILCDINIGNFEEAKDMISKAYKLKDTDNMQVVEHNEIVLYEKMLDFNTAYEKCQAYVAKYPEDEAMKKELEFLRTRVTGEK